MQVEKAPRFNIVTLGCEKNSVDSEGMGQVLAEAGYVDAPRPEEADVLIVNTCGFLQASTGESLAALQRLATHKRPDQLLIAAGCATQRYGADIADQVAGVDGLLSTRQWPQIAKLVDHLRDQQAHGTLPARTSGDDPVAALQARVASIEAALLAPVQPTAELKRFKRKPQGASAYVKISEGCDHACAFCIIPAIRGKHISRPSAEIAAEVRELAEQGVHEAIFIAQDSTYYGTDLQIRDGLAHLLEAVAAEAPTIGWVRLMYAYPTQITPRLIETMARLPQVCKYLDMPLQHGHPATLRRMRRPNDMARVRRLIADLRAAMPEIALRTTFIVGYPGETDEEFQTLLDFIAEIRFDHVGMFIYSPEEGTPGATLPDQVPERIKQRRYKQAMSLQQQISAANNARWVGKTLDVLIEGTGTVEDGRGRKTPILAGRYYRQAPEVDGLVFVKGHAGIQVGQVVPVRINQATEYDLWGKAVS
ncbi:MAG TPA: 30S ribosomal protein S12 methylthiotransferase RimO [Chloroflexia bacterium]|nr:30S ribosomal protein S12 methylthiotransferase RimO [Chloroflexia bacterium]